MFRVKEIWGKLGKIKTEVKGREQEGKRWREVRKIACEKSELLKTTLGYSFAF